MDDAVDRTVQRKGFPPKPGGGTPPPISSGSFVSWSGGKGRVDLIVTDGKVPGVEDEVEGTASSPAARVVVWVDGKATRKKIAAKTGTLKRIAPLTFGKRGKKDASADLMNLLAEHEQKIEDGVLPASAAVSGRTVKAVFDRGVQAWPGEAKTILSAEQWAVGRVEAFLTVAGGGEVKGYRRDVDLLPARETEHLTAPVEERVSIDPAELKAALAGLTE